MGCREQDTENNCYLGDTSLRPRVYFQSNEIATVKKDKMKQRVFPAILATMGLLVRYGLAVDCLAPSPCTCADDTVYCNNLNLKEVPKFEKSSVNYTHLSLLLYGNQLQTVPANAFYNLNTTNATEIHIYLNENGIRDISDGAFKGIENSLSSLHIQDNYLSNVPSALRNVTNLKYLSVYNNTIRKYDAQTMQAIGLNLEEFSTGDIKEFVWPLEFQYLVSLKYFSLVYYPEKSIPLNAFYGFESTLVQLRIRRTALTSVPSAVCRLTNLQALSLDTNTQMTGHAVLNACIPALTALRTILFSYNNLVTFPTLFRSFPALQNVRVEGNPLINYIDGDVIPSGTHIKELYISNNGFEQIPECVQNLTELTILDIQNNKIETVDAYNLFNMSHLRSLQLSFNPISYIAENAFMHLPLLKILSLKATKLTSLPRVVSHLPELMSLDLTDTQILCNCDMKWVEGWKRLDEVTIHGNCLSSSLPLKDYIAKFLPKCP